MTKPRPNLRAVFDTPESPPIAAPIVSATTAPAAKKESHPGKKPVLIHIPEAMHKDLRRVSLEEGVPLTQITEQLLREYLVRKGYTQHASS